MIEENAPPAGTGGEDSRQSTMPASIGPADVNVNQALDFLRMFAPEGPYVLTAIWPGEKLPPGAKVRIWTETFAASAMDEIAEWISRANTAGWNCYFMVNKPSRAMRRKAKKEDVAECRWLHCDIDPRAGEDLASERRRIQDKVEQLEPRPTAVIDSGGGFQIFYRLTAPISLGEAEARNKALAVELGGDTCWSADHIMRLPGTINWPDKKKRDRRRVPALARLVWFDEEQAHDPAAFRAIHDEEPAEGPTEAFHKNFADIVRKHAPRAERQLDLLRELADIRLGDLDPGIGEDGFSEAALSISQNMSTKPDADGDSSRSEVCVAFAGQCLRDGTELRAICSALYSPNFSASAHVLDPKHSRDRLRPIHRAVATAICTADQSAPAGLAIFIKAGELSRIVDEAEDALRRGGFGIYQRGGELTRAARLDCDEDASGVRRAAGALVLIPVRAPWLTEQFGRAATWLRHDARSEKWRPTDPEAKYANTYLARAGEWRLSVLRGIVEAPTLRADFSILQDDGYDPASGLILDKGGVEFPPVPESPTREQARAALDELVALFRAFPFEPEDAGEDWEPQGDEGARPSAARSSVLSAILTGLIRRTLRTAPLHGIDAPAAGTGKSLITEVVATILSGRSPAHMTQGKTAEEDEKRLVAVLRAGDAVLVIDNCDMPIQGDFLCSMLTQEVVQGRILGKSEMVMMPTNALVMATGNNLTFAGDMTRRALICRINAHAERPDDRRFDFDPRALARERRPQLVVAGLTVLRAYVAAGRPMRGEVPPVGSFEEWNVVREALIWLDQPDPAITRRRIAEADPVKERLIAIMEGWEKLGLGAMRISEVVRHLDADWSDEDRRPLRDALASLDPASKLNARRIGWHFRRIAGRVVAGRRFVRIKEGDGEPKYVLQKINQQMEMRI